jgi:hypothetical protein
MLIHAVSASYSVTDWTGELKLLAVETTFGTQNGRKLLRLPCERSCLLQSTLLARKRTPPRNRDQAPLATAVELPYLPRRRHFRETWLHRSFQAIHPPNDVCWWPSTFQAPGTRRCPPCPCLPILGLTGLPEPVNLYPSATNLGPGGNFNWQELYSELNNASHPHLEPSDEQRNGTDPATSESTTKRQH